MEPTEWDRGSLRRLKRLKKLIHQGVYHEGESEDMLPVPIGWMMKKEFIFIFIGLASEILFACWIFIRMPLLLILSGLFFLAYMMFFLTLKFT